MNTYGLMPPHDYETMDKVLQMVCETFSEGVINSTEIGLHNGNGSRGIHNFFAQRERINFHTAIDNNHDLQVQLPFEGCRLIIGNSYEVYNKLQDNSQHFLLIDGNHSYPITISDFFCYCKKVRTGGYIALHDTGEQIKPFTDYQGIGDRSDEDFYISCRKAASDLGLLGERCFVNGCTFQKILDEYDQSFPTGGLLVVKKIM